MYDIIYDSAKHGSDGSRSYANPARFSDDHAYADDGREGELPQELHVLTPSGSIPRSASESSMRSYTSVGDISGLINRSSRGNKRGARYGTESLSKRRNSGNAVLMSADHAFYAYNAQQEALCDRPNAPEVRKRIVLLTVGVLILVSQVVLWLPWLLDTSSRILATVSGVPSTAPIIGGGGGAAVSLRGAPGPVAAVEDVAEITRQLIDEYNEGVQRRHMAHGGANRSESGASVAPGEVMEQTEIEKHLLLDAASSGVAGSLLSLWDAARQRPFEKASAFKAQWAQDLSAMRSARDESNVVRDFFQGYMMDEDRIAAYEAELASDPLLLVKDNVERQHPQLLGGADEATRAANKDLLDYYMKVALRNEAVKAARRTDWAALTEDAEFPRHLKGCKNGDGDPGCVADATFTLVLQLSWDRAWMLDPICRRWRSPVAAAIYVPEMDDRYVCPRELGGVREKGRGEAGTG